LRKYNNIKNSKKRYNGRRLPTILHKKCKNVLKKGSTETAWGHNKLKIWIKNNFYNKNFLKLYKANAGIKRTMLWTNTFANFSPLVSPALSSLFSNIFEISKSY
jgi:hypothetical protein